MLDRSRALNVEYAAQSVLALLHQQLAGGGGGSARRYFASMKTIILTAENDRDYELVLLLAQHLGLRYSEAGLTLPIPETSQPDISQLTADEKRAILNSGGSGTSIPDPLAWQRAEREERPLPFRP